MSSSPKTTTPKRRSAEPIRRRSGASAGTARRPTAALDRFELEFWGVRGSLPAPGAATQKYGGNTPCLELRCGAQTLIFDLGTGARALGERMVSDGGPQQAAIFLSHYHYDHLQGVPFFPPFYVPGRRFRIFGATREGRTTREAIAGQMVPPYFPIGIDTLRASIDFEEVRVGRAIRVGDARVRAFELNHPGGSLSFRVDFRGRSLVYATDSEFGSDRDAPFARFARGTDVLVYDAMYTDEQYAKRRGWGHSPWSAAIEVARAAQAKTLVLFHHDPAHDDRELDRILRRARALRPGTLAAREGDVHRL